MRLRLLHTADWHLGQSLHGMPRDDEHGRFLAWLVDQIAAHAVDALVIAGDVFDVQNPPVSAQTAFYRFLAQAKARRPSLDVVVVAGNHDSGGRLEAPSPLLDTLGVRAVGGLARHADGTLALDRLLVPLHGADGRPAALCAAMPYLRPSDLPLLPADPPAPDAGPGDDDPFIDGVRRAYAEVLEAAAARLGPGEALVITGHCYMTGGQLSELSERKILGGNLHALPVDIFPENAAYVALGHLHRAQPVGGRDGVRYAGSPLPLALNEDRYPHQVMLVDLACGRLAGLTPLPVPRFVDILRLPAGGGHGSLDAALAALRALPAADDGTPRERWPYLEVAVTLDRPRPDVRDTIDAVLAGKAARLLRLDVRTTGSGRTLAEAAPEPELSAVSPEDVFRRLYHRSHAGEPDPRLLSAFHELVQAAQETDS